MSTSDWVETTLGAVVRLQRGHDLPETVRNEGTVPVIGSFGRTGWHNEAKQPGPGVTVGRSGGSIGVVSYVEIDYWPLNTSLYVTDFLGNDPRFCYYWLDTLGLANFNSGSAQPSLNRNHIYDLDVSLPPVIEQSAIAEILSSLDEKIELNRKQNRTLESIAQSLFKRWFVEFEFPDENGQPYKSSGGAMQSSELEEIPVGWEIGTFGEEFEIVMGQSPSGDTYNDTGDGMVFFQGRTDFGFRFPDIRIYCTDPKKRASKGDVLLCVRAPVGDLNVAFEDCCIGRGLAAVKSRHKSFTYYKLKYAYPVFQIFETEGTVFGSISKAGFEGIESVIPPNTIVQQFNELIGPLDSKIDRLTSQIRTLSKLRNTLLPKLMSGELRVSNLSSAEQRTTHSEQPGATHAQ